MRRYLLSLALVCGLLGTALTASAQHGEQQQAPAQLQRPPVAAPAGGAGNFGSNAAVANPFPDHPGRQIVAVACTQCHGPNVFTQLRMGEKGWRAQIYDMILRGAQIGPEDIDTAVQYMVASCGPGVPFPGQQPLKVALANGRDKEIVEGGCGLCHGLDRVVATKRSKEQWQLIVNRMVFFGALLTAEQVSSTVDYLAANYATTQTASVK